MRDVTRFLLTALSLGALLAGTAPRLAADPSPNTSAPGTPAAPAVLVSDQRALDAGEVVEGAEPNFSFTLTNQGTETLKLQVRTSCGCTVAHLDPTIAPGGHAVLEAKVNTRGMHGRVTKTISVRPEGGTASSLELQVALTVRPLIRVEPAVAAYLLIKDKGTTSTEFTLTPEPGQGVELTQVVSSIAYLQARLAPAATPGGPRKLVVSVAPDAPLGHLQGTITVATTSTVVPRVNLIITGEKGISVSPQLVFWGVLPDGKSPAHEELIVTKHGGHFKIKQVQSDDPLIQIKVEPIEAGTKYRLLVSYAGGWKTGLVRQTLTVKTDDRRQPELKIPVQAVIANPGAGATSVPPTTTF
jgi:Protein of unknown function (DUF1573)